MKNMSDFPRGELTSQLLTQLAAVALIGDGEAPSAGGWDDDPSLPDSNYAAYVVLMPLPAQRGAGSFGDSASEWRLSYSLTSFGVTREQVEFYAGKTRDALVDINRSVLTLDTKQWKVIQAEVNTIGGVARNDNTEPSEFSEIDTVTLWMSKEM